MIASHSSAFALAEHPRNVPDDVLKLVAKNGGVVMVNFYSGFITPEAARTAKDMFQACRELQAEVSRREASSRRRWSSGSKEHPIPRGSVHDVVDHIEHIIKVAGIDHVGLGSDFDGINVDAASSWKTCRAIPYITQELLNRGYSKEEIHKILGGNMLRVMRAAEQVAKDGKK